MDLLRQLRVAGAFGLSITVVAIIVGFVIPASGPLVDGILAPGYFLPVAY
jgi:hypothetical protein